MDNIRQILGEYGLNEKETALYLAALSLGDSGMTELAEKAGLKRTTAYVVFESMQDRGLMGGFEMKSGTKFVATAPEILIKKSQKQSEELKTILPQLKALENRKDIKPKINYFEGKEGYLVATEDSLKNPNTTVRHIGSLTEVHKIIGLDYDTKYYIPSRVKNRIRFKALYFKSQTEKEIEDRNHADELREIKYLPENFIYKTSMLIYGNKVAIFSSKKELITIIVESEEIAESERQKFDLIWSVIGGKTNNTILA